MADKYSHKLLTNTALPYISNASVIDEHPRYVGGSNVMTSIKGYIERRPGFPLYMSNPFADETVKRVFTWRRWNSDFFVMVSTLTQAGIPKIYKIRVGTDTQFSLLASLSGSDYADYAVANNHVFISNGGSRLKYDGTTLSEWGIQAPGSPVTTALVAGGLTAAAGYKYVICFENSSTGHLSSPSPIMSARVKPVSQNVILTGNTTVDSQVNRVRIFRTTDAGSRYFELPTSPVSYATWIVSGHTDTNTDSSLLSTEAPAQNQNNKPTPGVGLTWWAGRIWLYSNDKLYYSGFEEIKRNHGVTEECFPIENYYNFGAEITGLIDLQDALLVYTASTIYRITGDTRASFKRDTLAKRAGTRSRATLTTTGRAAAWLDSSNIIRLTDGLSIQELSLPIRPDIKTIDHSQAAMSFHDNGQLHWLVLMDGGTGKLRVFDQDTNQWMPPWSISTVQAVHSGEIAAGSVQFFLGRQGKILSMNESTYADESVAYTASAKTGLVEIARAPHLTSSVVHIGIERNDVVLDNLNLATDDDPETANYVDLSKIPTNPTIPHNRKQGKDLIEEHFKTDNGPACRRISLSMGWPDEETNFKAFAIDIAYQDL